MICAVKFPPVKTLSNELMSLVRQVSPGPQTEMAPMMLLGAYGYPQFPGVSETEGVTMFFFKPQKGEETTPMVILTKMEPDALMRKGLTMKAQGDNPMMGFLSPGLEVRDQDGWTLFSNNAANFDYAKDVDALVKRAEKIQGFDITARFYIGPDNMAEWAEQLKETIAEEHSLKGLEPSDPQLMRQQSLVDLMAMIGENLEWGEFGLDISEENVSLGMTALAIDGTPEARFFSIEGGGAAPVANYVPASTISYIAKSDMKEWVAYYDVLAKRALLVSPPDAKPIIDKTSKYVHELAPQFSNAMAASISIPEPSQMEMSSATLCDLDQELFKEAMRFCTEELVPYARQYFGSEDLASTMPKTSFKENVGEVFGSPVDAFESTYESMEFDWDNLESEPETVTKTDTTYYWIGDGAMVSATSLEQIKTLAENVVEKKTVENSVASKVQLAEGELLGLKLELGDLIHLFIQNAEPESEMARQALMKLANRDIKPVTASVRSGNNELTYVWSAPRSSIQAISETIRTINQAEMEMENYGGSAQQPKGGEAPSEGAQQAE